MGRTFIEDTLHNAWSLYLYQILSQSGLSWNAIYVVGNDNPVRLRHQSNVEQWPRGYRVVIDHCISAITPGLSPNFNHRYIKYMTWYRNLRFDLLLKVKRLICQELQSRSLTHGPWSHFNFVKKLGVEQILCARVYESFFLAEYNLFSFI
jgi:hypothetical protein